MRCHEVKESLLHRLDADKTDLASSPENAELEEHLEHCSDCRAFWQSQHHVDALLDVPASSASSAASESSALSAASRPNTHVQPSPQPLMMSRTGRVSTSSIMLAVQRQTQISQQVVRIQHQQQYRVAQMRTGGLAFAVLAFLALGSVPLLLLTIMFVETDTMVNILSFLRSIIDVFYVLALSLQTALIVVTHNNLLLSLLAFAVVLMMGMWIRLMRPKSGL
ncbi:MAG TPA: hypothetical protein DHW02_22955 [Ktedonobacter sp.]|nr:hypothetical protein [Ktedonobacter sp.]